jgi:predicted outer membrane repeat protein
VTGFCDCHDEPSGSIMTSVLVIRFSRNTSSTMGGGGVIEPVEK